VRRCEREFTDLSHHIIRFESSGISVPITGLDDATIELLAARWCATARRLSRRSGRPSISVLSECQMEELSVGDFAHRFGSWRAVLRPGSGSDDVFRVGDIGSAADFQRAVDLCVTHALTLRGAVVVHGAAFEFGGRGVMVVGNSGSGKSTVAAGALRRLLLLARRPVERIGVETLRRELYFRAPGVSIVPRSLADGLVPVSDSGETRWRLGPEASPGSFAASAMPEVLWLVAVDRRLRKSRVATADQAEALAWLLRGLSGLLLSDGFDRERGPVLDVLTGLVAGCRTLKMRLGRDLLVRPEETMDRFLVLSEEG
jgi:hypothetical protein